MNPIRLPLFVAAALCCAGMLRAADATKVQMLPDSGELQPGTTIEFRFPEAMVDSDHLGPAAESPVVFKPDLAGSFTWLSTRSGVFSPSGPLPLGAAWEAGVRPGLKTAQGHPAPQDFHPTLSTPPFGVTTVANGVWDEDNVSPDVSVRLAFNLPVTPDAAFFHFVDADGKRIPATVRFVGRNDYFNVPAEAEEWSFRWQLAHDPAAERNSADEGFSARLFITPATPLPSGNGWTMVLDAGFPSGSGDHKLDEPYRVSLGTVNPFTLDAVESGNYINSGPTLTLQFNSAIAPDITSENAAEFFTVTPMPPDPEWEIGYDTVILRGKFELGREYKLTIAEGACSSSGQAFEGNREHTLKFGPVAPRLYLPELTMAQILGGRRQLPVRSVNLESLQIKATLLPADQAARALAAFTAHEWKYSEGEPIPTGEFKGTVLRDKTLPLTDTAPNLRQTTDLDWTELLGGKKAGVILLELKGIPFASVGGKPPGAQALIQLTDLGILWKKVGNTIRTHVFSNSSAAPLNGAVAELLDADFKPVAKAATDASGDAELAYETVPAWLQVRSGDDTCVLRMGPSADTLRAGEWFYADWNPASATASNLRSMIFTDRPLYQPGETIHLKGFVRRTGADGLQIADGVELALIFRNPEFSEIQRLTVTTGPQGDFDAGFTVPAAPLGSYSVQVELPGSESGASVHFLVSDYQPDAFEITLEMPEQWNAGEGSPEAQVSGKYFFGGRITTADVRWTLRYSRESFMPSGFEMFQFLDERDEEEAKSLTLHGDGNIADGNPLTIAPELPTPELSPFRGVLTAEVTDLNQQTVSASTSFTRESSDFYLGIRRPDEHVVRLGDEVAIPVAAVRPDGQPVDKPVDIDISIEKWRFNVVRVLGAGGAVTFRRDLIKEPLLENRVKTVAVENTKDGWSAGDRASLRFKTGTVGHHQVTVTANDSGGHKVVTTTSFYVYGKGETVWDYSNPYEVTLVPDKESYLPGDTARILVQTPISGEAHINIERASSILRSQRIPLEGNAPVIEIPIDEADAPGVTVSLVILRGSDESPRKFPAPDFRFGVCPLRVDLPSAKLDVAITPEKPGVMPGEEVAAVISVKDHRGKPVSGAGVTFYAVDDGVLALTGFTRPHPAEVFLAPVGTRILTGLSLAQLLPEDPEDLKFSNKGYLIGGGGEGGPVALRENFPGTACWMPSLVTDENGSVTARFPAPDALTRYRLIAVVTSGASSFGSAESSINIARPLMILPSLGQFANAGDHLVARAVVRNETGTDGTVEVTLKTPASTDKVTLDVPNGSSRAADFKLSFKNPGTADLEWSATMDAGGKTFADRVKTTLPVRSPMLQLRETYFTALDQSTNNLLANVNPQMTEGRGEVVVTVSNTRLAALGANARFLVDYPYGCAEQRTSALVPWLVMPALGPLMPGFARDGDETARVIRETIDGLFDLQTADGGFSFWPGSQESSPFASAWAAIVMSRAEQQDIAQPKGMGKLLEYLAASLRGIEPGTSPSSLAERAFAAYALALSDRAEAAYHEELYRRRGDMSREARAVLALAIMEAKGPRKMVAELLRADRNAPEAVSPYGNALRESAIRLLAWTHHDPKNKEVGILVTELLAFGPRSAGVTTQSNAWALLAFSDYYTIVEQAGRGPKNVRGTIVSGTSSAPFDVDNSRPAFREIFPVAPGKDPAVLRVDNPAAAPLYGETGFAVYPPLGEQPPQDRGFAVSRSYRKIGNDGSLQPAENLSVGDRIVVTLRVETALPAHFVVIDDPLPAILEAVNPDFVSRSVGAADESTPWVVSHRETRSDRVVYFCDAMAPGAFTFQYLARVRMAGDATAGATKAEAMYRPERFGLGTISRLSSKPDREP